MDKDFWHQKWANNQIAFHASEANPLLIKHIASLSLKTGNRVFVPLCGKTLDIAWLLSKGYSVAGVELVETAIKQLFDELGVEPDIAAAGKLKRYRANNLDVFVGDIFDLSLNELGSIDAVYDRAAFVALPEALLKQYVTHVADITKRAPQLLITYEYDKTLMDGPPFSHTRQEISHYYSDRFNLELLSSEQVEGGLKDFPAQEYVWLLNRKNKVE